MIYTTKQIFDRTFPESKVHGANMGPTWVLPSPGGPHVGPINLAARDTNWQDSAPPSEGTQFCHLVLALKLLSGDPSKSYVMPVSINWTHTHNSHRFTMLWRIPWNLEFFGNLGKILKHDTFLYILLFVLNCWNYKWHFSSITLRVEVSGKSQRLFLVGIKPLLGNLNVVHESFHCAFQIFHIV